MIALSSYELHCVFSAWKQRNLPYKQHRNITQGVLEARWKTVSSQHSTLNISSSTWNKATIPSQKSNLRRTAPSYNAL